MTKSRKYLEEGGRYGMYDLENDPDDPLNLASDNPDRLGAMMQVMVRELESVNGYHRKLKQGC